MMRKEFAIKNSWVYIGMSWTRFGFGFAISKYSLDLDLGFFWIGVEF